MAPSRTRVVLSTMGAVVALAVGPGGAQGVSAHANSTPLPTIYVNYTVNCTFTIVNDDGQPVTQMPPGTYQVVVDTPVLFNNSPGSDVGCPGWVQFQLTGPGVDISTTLETGCDDYLVFTGTVFAPSSTFVALDNTDPSGTRTTFTTAATGTPPQPNGYGGSIAKKTSLQNSGDVVGSKLSVTHHLGAVLSAKGVATLMTSTGKQALNLAQGKTVIAVDDLDAKASFYIQQNGSPPVRLTPEKFRGRKNVLVTFTPGIWKYYASPHGAVHLVIVIG